MIHLPGVQYARYIQGFHAAFPAWFTKVAGVVVGKAHHVEAGADQVLYIARRRSENIAHLRVLAGLSEFPFIQQSAFQVAERNIGVAKHRLHIMQKEVAVARTEVCRPDSWCPS